MARRRSVPLKILEFSAVASIAFALVNIMICVMPTPHRLYPVDLPQGNHARSMPGALREDPLQVMVLRDGVIRLGNHAVTATGLTEEIRENVRRGAPNIVYFRVDARTRYRDAATALDAVRAAGVHNVNVMTDARRP